MELHNRGNLWLYAIVTSLHFGNFVIKNAVNHDFPLWGWYYIYLTIISGTMQLLYFALCVLEHVWARLDRSENTLRAIQKARDFSFASIIFPVSIFVGVAFYTVILHFGTSIMDVLFANYDHGVCTILVLLEIYFVSHNYPEDELKIAKQVAFIITFGVCYLAWNFICYELNNEWVYPFQKDLPFWSRFLAYPFMELILVAFYFLGYYINRKLHRTVLAGSFAGSLKSQSYQILVN